MFFNFKIIFFLIIFISSSNVFASEKNNIIQNLKDIQNISFNFEQNINGKIENGKCTIEYSKKINCKYNLQNNKVLISNGRSIVVKTSSSFYIYPIEKTPLNQILDKKLILKKLSNLTPRIIDNSYVNFKFSENNNEINLFFDKKTSNLIGWQTLDIYQNLSITYLNSIVKNQKLKKDLFKLPKQN
tara:strand:+ start:1727 stop:2284 length:558 start_codon:yes stop_codon:yes gene_type:complete